MNLNAGGIIGGLAGAGIGFAVVMGMNEGEFQPRSAKLVILGVVLGAFAGNAIWGLVFPKPKVEDEEAEEDRPRRRRPADDDEEEDRPRRRRIKASEEDDDDRPRRRRTAEDDDEDDEPQRRPRRSRRDDD